MHSVLQDLGRGRDGTVCIDHEPLRDLLAQMGEMAEADIDPALTVYLLLYLHRLSAWSYGRADKGSPEHIKALQRLGVLLRDAVVGEGFLARTAGEARSTGTAGASR